MRLKFLSLTLCCAVLTISAQDIYKVEQLSSSDLTGTARFVGMGGAMNALGADMSTMGSNPAAIGLYRKNDVALTAALNGQPNGQDFFDRGKLHMSFDQMGMVYAMRLRGSAWKFVNFGINYQKRRNLKNFLGIDLFSTGGLSQSWQMMDLAYTDHWLDLSGREDCNSTTPLTILGYDTQMIEPVRGADGSIEEYIPSDAETYSYRRAQWGGTHQFDFNLSFNWNDQVYFGATFGAYDVSHHSAMLYNEEIRTGEIGDLGQHVIAPNPYQLVNQEELTGSGFDFKMGLILRPIEESPFRIGLSFSTPTWFDLTQNAYAKMTSPYECTQDGHTYPTTTNDTEINDYDYRIRTPWRLQVSMATTVGTSLALDAEYEYSDLGTAAISYPDGSYLSGHKDQALTDEAKHFLQPTHTFRAGAELRAAGGVYLRLGYNYVSRPMKRDAYLNLFTASDSYWYNTNTDYVNLSDINRVTAGLGLRGKHWYADLSYQYQKQLAEVSPFHVPEAGSEINRLEPAKFNLNRQSAALTVGYKF